MASIGSTARRGQMRAMPSPKQAQHQPAERHHDDGAPGGLHPGGGAEMLVHVDAEQEHMRHLRRGGHQEHQHAGARAGKGGQHHQPDFVGTDQCAQRLWRVQDRRAEWAMPALGRVAAGFAKIGLARTRLCPWAGAGVRPRGWNRQGQRTCADVQTTKGTAQIATRLPDRVTGSFSAAMQHSWNQQPPRSTAVAKLSQQER